LSTRAYKKASDSAQDWTQAEDNALRSWVLDIVPALLPGVKHVEQGADRKYLGQGGLVVHRGRGCWYLHAEGKGGYSPIPLIQHLKNCSRQEAIVWGKAWLANHPGTGSCQAAGDVDGDIDGTVNAVAAIRGKELLERAQPSLGTIVERYLTDQRKRPPPYPDAVQYAADARLGEDALLVPLTAFGTTVGAHLVYLETEGRKSLIDPRKRTYMIEEDKKRRAPGVFEYVPHDLDPALPILVCEGIEDWLSLIQAFPKHRIIGLPGIQVLAHIVVSKDAKYRVFRDGDAPGSPADKGLIRGVDHLLLEGASEVLVTQTPAGEDSNSILQRDVEAVRALLPR
jgi:hypothetical protein